MKKSILRSLMFITVLTAVFVAGCFNENKTDKGIGVKLQRTGVNLDILSDGKYLGEEVTINKIISEKDISTENGIESVVTYKGEKTVIAVAKKDGEIAVGEKIITVIVEGDVEAVLTDSADKAKMETSKKATVRATAGNTLLGDFNKDKIVNILDFTLFKNVYGKTSLATSEQLYDIAPAQKGTDTGWTNIYSKSTADGKIDLIDFVIFAINYNKEEPVSIVTPVSIAITGETSVIKNNSISLTGVVTYSNSTTDSVGITWSSSNETIATVSTTGVVTGKSAGAVVITATKGTVTKTVSINVIDNIKTPQSIAVTGTANVNKGSTVSLTATTTYSDSSTDTTGCVWTSGDSLIASVDASGVVTGVKAGTVTITASKGSISGNISITVKDVVKTVSTVVITGTGSVEVTKTVQLSATITYSDSTTETTGATWSSSDAATASVDANGVVTGVKAGTATITASKGGVTSSAKTVTVTVPFADGIKVHFKSAWTAVYIHYWTTVGATGTTWASCPAMTDDGNGWFSYTIAGATSTNMLFKDKAGDTTNKSGDQTGIKTGEHWFDGTTWTDYDPDNTAPTVTATPESKTYNVAQQVVLKTKATTDKIYYTLDGTTPTTASTEYSAPINVPSPTMLMTIKAFGVNSKGTKGEVAVFTYTVDPSLDMEPPTITASLASGYYETAQSVSFTIKDNSSSIVKAYYTIDGSEPTVSSPVYVEGIATSGKTGAVISIPASTTPVYKNYKFLVVDSSGNKATDSFSYSSGPKPTRNDFREESIYFAITTRFYDGEPTNNRYCRADDTSGNRANNDPPWRGDFKGLIQKLDYIKAMGFTAVWITPVVQNRSDYDFHGYHAWDFNKIDARLETPGASYQDLINEIHKRGMKLIQDIVLNHSCRYGAVGLQTVKYWGDRNDPEWGANGTSDPAIKGYYDEYNPDFTYNGLDKEPKSGKEWYNGDLWQKEVPANVWVTPNSGDQPITNWGVIAGQVDKKPFKWHYYQWPTLALFDPQFYHKTWLKNWEDETCQTGTMHEDCIDLDTESKAVQDYLINAYNKMIDMGVDGFRIDTVKHVSRNTFNRRYIPAFKKRGGDNFFLFGEVCTRVNEVWNKGNAPLSTPFYTWKERKDYSADDEAASHEAYAYEFGQGTGSQPTSTNHSLDGNLYHKPDYTKYSGLSVIDFPMHWNFKDAGSAFGIRGSDNCYNDATWNVTYFESHDYSPWEAPNNASYRSATSQDTVAEDYTLLWTFRGIPCLYYGDEILDATGKIIDAGPSKPLAETGRPYYGDKIEGSVTVSDFGVYSGATGKMATTLSNPLAMHVQRLNRIRLAIPALQKGQYSTEGCSGMAFKRRFTDTATGVDSYVLVTISGGCTFTGVLNGTYTDAVTGDVKVVTNGTLTATCSGQANMRAYVLDLGGTNKITGKIGEAGAYLK